MTQPAAVTTDIVEAIAIATLSRPQSLNAIDEAMLAGLEEMVTVVAGSEAKALVITGAGDAFCVGLDIGLLERAFADHGYFREVLDRLRAILLGIEHLPLPVIAAVNGTARAGGFELALAADIVIVAEDARIGDTHLASGIMPGGGATQRAPRKLGDQRARELIYTGRWMDGREAAASGFALRAVPRAYLAQAVGEITQRLKLLSRPALAATKAAIVDGAGRRLDDALTVELEHFARFLETEPSADEGLRAFLEKRDPKWD